MRTSYARALCSTLAVASALAGCAGEAFRLDPELASSGGRAVTGPRTLATCPADTTYRAGLKTGVESLAEKTMFRAGDLSLVTGPVHTEVDEKLSTAEAAFQDVARMHTAFGANDERAKALEAAVRLSPSADSDKLVVAVNSAVSVLQTFSEKARVSFLAKRGEREIVALCATVDKANGFGQFDPPHFTLSCVIVSEASKQPSTFSVRGQGTWPNYRFEGVVFGSHWKWKFATQSMIVLGKGGIRGFDVHAGEWQIGAVSFEEEGPLDAQHHASVAAKTWQRRLPEAERDDALAMVLALAYAYPWPNGCDGEILRARFANHK